MNAKEEGVVIERLNELKNQNTIDHGKICDRLDFTNGKVRSGEIWRHSIIAMGTVITAVVVPLVLYIAFDAKKDIEEYREEHKETAEIVRQLSQEIGR